MKKFLAAVVVTLLGCAGVVAAQSTPVAITATVTGANGAPFVYGSYQIQLADQSGNPLNNIVPAQTQFSGALSATGSLALSIYPNSAFALPAGVTSTQWKFTVCSAQNNVPVWLQSYYQCYSSLVTVTTAGSYSAAVSTGAPAVYWNNMLTGSAYYNSTNVSGALTAVTNPNPYDFSTQVATDAFTTRLTNLQMANVPIGSVTGGTYSFNSAGIGALANYTASGGVITSILVWIPSGSGYQVGDLVTFQAGNYDSLVRITAVTSGQPTAGTILYGGTGYVSGTSITETGANAVQFTFLLSGTLTSNATFVNQYGSYLSTGNQWLWANNTTGAFTVTVCQAAAAGSQSCGGRTVTLPQGTNNSTMAFIQTDGVANVDSAVQYIPGNLNIGGSVSVAPARVGTFVCTGAGTINITNSYVVTASNVVISLRVVGGTVTTPPAMNALTSGVSFTVLCGATDTSTYNYAILN
jgi:hypothetical protein